MARQDNKRQPGRDRNQLGQHEPPQHAPGAGSGAGAKHDGIEGQPVGGQQQQQRRSDEHARSRGENLAGRGSRMSDEDDV